MLAGFCIMALAETAVCVLLGGLQVIRSYADLLRNKSLDRLSPSPELMIGYQGFAANLGIQSPVVLLAIIAVVVVIFLFAVRQAPLWRMFALTATASLCIAPHAYGYDATLLLLPLWLTIFSSTNPASRISATLMATPLPFGFALADKPWAVVSSASLILFFVILAMEALRPPIGAYQRRESAVEVDSVPDHAPAPSTARLRLEVLGLRRARLKSLFRMPIPI
jgi:hypothetical protein